MRACVRARACACVRACVCPSRECAVSHSCAHFMFHDGGCVRCRIAFLSNHVRACVRLCVYALQEPFPEQPATSCAGGGRGHRQSAGSGCSKPPHALSSSSSSFANPNKGSVTGGSGWKGGASWQGQGDGIKGGGGRGAGTPGGGAVKGKIGPVALTRKRRDAASPSLRGFLVPSKRSAEAAAVSSPCLSPRTPKALWYVQTVCDGQAAAGFADGRAEG